MFEVYFGQYGQPCLENRKTGKVYKFSPHIKMHDLQTLAELIGDLIE